MSDIHVPDDAGIYHDALYRLLERIPARWGRQLRCDAGWYPILAEFESKLGEGVEINQIKEKFGTLRIYAEGVRADLDPLIEAAEKQSEITCELCSAPGTLANKANGSYVKTVCVLCANENGFVHERRFDNSLVNPSQIEILLRRPMDLQKNIDPNQGNQP